MVEDPLLYACILLENELFRQSTLYKSLFLGYHMHYISLFLTHLPTEAKMPMIKIMGAPELIEGEVPAHWQALIGQVFEADGQAVKKIREIHREDIPPAKDGHYEIFVGDATEKLLNTGNESAATFWGLGLSNGNKKDYLIPVPYDCAVVMETA